MPHFNSMNQSFLEYFRCPDCIVDFKLIPEESQWRGHNSPQLYEGSPERLGGRLFDALSQARIEGCTCYLPFNPTDVANYLRLERFVDQTPQSGWKQGIRKLYYALRPALPVSIRRHLQRASLKGWDRKPFPRWPVDQTVDHMFERLMALLLKAQGRESIPFIWFWPNAKAGCAIVTHDIETSAGLAFLDELMNIDESFGIKSSFQFIPESRYTTPQQILSQVRQRGFEVNVHDLTHDGHLFDEESQFRERAKRINEYVVRFGSKGYRSGVLYRNLNWYDAFEFSYDMSVPNVAHLDPQPGGCCTTMPFYIGKILELPLTTVQDYSMFAILETYSTELWDQQIETITKGHGLMSFNVHPDYLNTERAKNTYKTLLRTLARLRSTEDVWVPLPGDVDTWWRQRSRMQIVPQGAGWRIEGPGAERARLAFATLDGDSVSYSIASAPEPQTIAAHL